MKNGKMKQKFISLIMSAAVFAGSFAALPITAGAENDGDLPSNTTEIFTEESIPNPTDPTEDMDLTASSEQYGDLYYTVNEDNTITITDCDESATEVTIPSEINGMPVTSIGDDAFYSCNSLTSVTLNKE